MEALPEEQVLTPAEQLLQDVLVRLDSSGDLPIFSASVSRIQLVGSDPEINAMDLAVEVLKDANLTTKILKLANSTYYNRGRSNKVGALSRAVVVLGFDVIKSTVVAMKLIDSFQQTHPGVELEGLLVRAYMAAGFVREIAEVAGVKKPEESYICGLLHGLGEIVLASVMPEHYRKMQDLVEHKNMSWNAAQKQVIHQRLYEIGQAVAARWEFPEATTASMQPMQGNNKGPIKDSAKFNRATASLTADIMELLYVKQPHCQQNFAELCQELATVAGVGTDAVAISLEKAFRQSSELAESYGLDKSCLFPALTTARSGSDDQRDEMAKLLLGQLQGSSLIEDERSLFNDSDDDDGYGAEAAEVADVARGPVSPRYQGDANALLSIIQQMTLLIAQKAPLNTVFNKALEGIVDGLGFDRAMLCLMTPDRNSYAGRIVYGEKAHELREIFRHCPLNEQRDLFSQVILQGQEMLVEDARASRWSALLSAPMVERLNVNSFLIASMRVHNKPVGLFYTDKVRTRTATNNEQYRGFLQLVSQAQLALQVR